VSLTHSLFPVERAAQWVEF